MRLSERRRLTLKNIGGRIYIVLPYLAQNDQYHFKVDVTNQFDLINRDMRENSRISNLMRKPK